MAPQPVPGDVVRLRLGTVVRADMRLLTATALEYDEGVLTGEVPPGGQTITPVPPGAALGDLASMALMGTVVHAGEGMGVVVATGSLYLVDPLRAAALARPGGALP